MHTSTSTIRRAPVILTVLLSIAMLAMPTIPAWAAVTDPQPGDLMANAGHAGIYIGNGLMIHAMNPVDGTKVTAVMPGMGYYRLLG